MAEHRLKRGLDLPLAGAPEQVVHPAARATTVALLGDDYVGLSPTFLVAPGERVRLGQALFVDKKNPGVRFTAPASGTVAALHRGEQRAFRSSRPTRPTSRLAWKATGARTRRSSATRRCARCCSSRACGRRFAERSTPAFAALGGHHA